jgi:hypothetical protein
MKTTKQMNTRELKGKSRMDNPEKLATLGTQNTTQQRKLKDEQHRPNQKPGVNLGAHDE